MAALLEQPAGLTGEFDIAPPAKQTGAEDSTAAILVDSVAALLKKEALAREDVLAPTILKAEEEILAHTRCLESLVTFLQARQMSQAQEAEVGALVAAAAGRQAAAEAGSAGAAAESRAEAGARAEGEGRAEPEALEGARGDLEARAAADAQAGAWEAAQGGELGARGRVAPAERGHKEEEEIVVRPPSCSLHVKRTSTFEDMVGHLVRHMSTGRCGKIIEDSFATDATFKVHFSSAETAAGEWVNEEEVELTMSVGCRVALRRTGQVGFVTALDASDAVCEVLFDDGDSERGVWCKAEQLELLRAPLSRPLAADPAGTEAGVFFFIGDDAAHAAVPQADALAGERKEEASGAAKAPEKQRWVTISENLVGHRVEVRATGRTGHIIAHDSSDLPFKLQFDDAVRPYADWLKAKDVRLILDVGCTVHIKATGRAGIVVAADKADASYQVHLDDEAESATSYLFEEDLLELVASPRKVVEYSLATGSELFNA